MGRRWYIDYVDEPGVMQFTMASGGRVGYVSSASATEVWVLVRPTDEGRLAIVDMYVTRERGPLTSDDLRQIPIGRIEAFVNRPDKRDWLLEHIEDGSSLEEVARQERGSRASQLERIKSQGSRQRLRRAKLPVPEGRKYPDSFYTKVAAAYLDLSAEGGRPAAEMAEANGVPTSQVHRWIREARRRGLLPPGRVGKAG